MSRSIPFEGEFTFAERFAQIVKRYNATSYEIAKATGLSQSTISRLRTGELASPSIGTVKLISNYFGLTISQFIGEEKLPDDVVKYTDADTVVRIQKVIDELSYVIRKYPTE